MSTSYELDDHLPDGMCSGCGQCDGQDEFWLDDEDVYDDPYEVVMYDIDAEDDDLYALIDMLGDSARSWYASRRLNALAASGPLSALVAAIIIDSLGRRWNPLEHPRDRFGRFIETGGFIRWLVGGDWLRGQVSRIDSDGNIHVRSAGNDSVPDGSVYRFKPELANKLVSTEEPVASLEDIDLDADIPDFPEASPVQKRIWNNLANGDIPAEDLDRALADLDLSVEDFAGEVTGLEERSLIEIDRSGDKPRVRRNDADAKAAIDVSDDEIDDIPDDETPDLDDSPAFTKAQRDLLDRIVEADRGEDDGVGRDEIGDDAFGDDIQALIDAGALEENDGGRLFLENPEGGDAPEVDAPDAEPDLTTEIFDASKVLDDPDAQEAFQHYAEELARPGDENNAPLPEDLAPAKRRNAEAAANKWWEERNAGTSDDIAEAPEADVPEAEQANPKDALNPRNQAMADELLAEYFPDDEFLDGNIGVEYRGALKRMFDAHDYNEAGFGDAAGIEMDKAEREMRRIEVPDEDIEGWPIEVENMRNADREGPAQEVVSEVAEDVLPEGVSDEVVPDAEPEISAPVDLMDRPSAQLYLRDHPRAAELLDEGAEEYQWGYEAANLDEAAGLPPLTDEEADSLWGANSAYNEGYIDAVADRVGAGEGTPGADVVPEEALSEDAAPEEGFTVTPAPSWKDYAARLAEEAPADEFYARLEQEAQIAEELGLDHFDEDAPWSWQNLSEGLGYRPAELLFNDSDGNLGTALAKDPAEFERQYENELLQKFQDQDSNIGPDVMRLRKAGLVEDDGDNGWRLTAEGRTRLGLADSDIDEVRPDQAFRDGLPKPFGPREAPLDRPLVQIDDDSDALDVAPGVDTILSEEEAIANAPGVPKNDQDRINEEVRQSLIRQAQEPGTPIDPNPRKVEGQRNFKPEDIPLLNNDDEWGDEATAVGAQDVAQAMWDAQNNFITPEAAYEIAAEQVRAGRLNQNDLDKISNAVEQHLEGRGQKWINDLGIDYVGDDQRPRRVDPEAIFVEDQRAPAAADAPGPPVPKSASEHPKHQRLINQKPFDIDEFPQITEEGKGALDRGGRPIKLGDWYKANRGGGGEPLEAMGFYDQDLYPGWILGRAPDGKYKAVHVEGRGGRGGQGGINRISPVEVDGEIRDWAAQRRAKKGENLDELDQFKAGNKMFDNLPAEVGMLVERREVKGARGDGGKFKRGDAGIVARFGMDEDGNIKVFVARPGAKNQDDLVEVKINMLQKHVPAPPTPTPAPTPTPDAPNIDPNNLPDREWPVPSDQELLDRINGMGGQVEFVPFNNAHQNPGAVYEQAMALINNGQLEFVPADEAGGKMMIRVPGDGQGAPAVDLPAGAENDTEGRVLSIIDGANDEGLLRSELVDLDADDIDSQFAAITALVERGVLERYDDNEDGRARYRRGVATPEPEGPAGAQNELEADLLNIIDIAGETGVLPDALVDVDADDAVDRMQALRSLVDRRVLQRDSGAEGGRPVYRRAPTAVTGTRTHNPARGTNAGGQPMDHAQAVEALRGGADPMTVNTSNMYKAMKESGRFEFRGFKKDGNVSGTEWAIDNQVTGPFAMDASGNSNGRVYVVKKPRETNPRGNWRAELYAGAISHHVGLSDGDPGPNEGGLFQPQTTSASKDRVIMDHFGYSFPEGTTFPNVTELTRQEKRTLAEDRVRLVLYDYMINNSLDRHSYNQVYARLPDGSLRVVIIDNGLGDGENYAKTDPDMGFKEFIRKVGWDRNKSHDLLRDVGDFNDGLTREELRSIVTSFFNRYGRLDANAVLESLIRNNELEDGDIANLRMWLNGSQNRVQSLGSDTDAVVNAIAAIIGVP